MAAHIGLRPSVSILRHQRSHVQECSFRHRRVHLHQHTPRSVLASAASLSLAVPLSGLAASLSSSGMSGGTRPGERPAKSDPSASGEDVSVVRTPEEFMEILAANPESLVVLMCKAIGCRPCKMFARKYQRVASTYTDCLFLEVTGDETTNLRKMMIQMGVRATPTFRLYRAGECVKVHVGIDESKLRSAVKSCLREREAGYERPESGEAGTAEPVTT